MTTEYPDTDLAPEVVRQLLDLPVQQREDLGIFLLDSTDETVPTDEEWLAKIERRIQTYLENPTDVLSAEESLAQARKQLADYAVRKNGTPR